ncbi:hypothetical protein ACFWPH_28695 [Nocardia sp. NPDC058499]|uniref:hypothetical protein n=1 Tax=Nocardia sp. NPDC058499 TaxID=3346530 RepID=UPI00364B4DF1
MPGLLGDMPQEPPHRTFGIAADRRDLVRSPHPRVSAAGATLTAHPHVDPEGKPPVPEKRPLALRPLPVDPAEPPVGKTTATMRLPWPAGAQVVLLDGRDLPVAPDVRHGDEPTAESAPEGDRA